MSHTEAKAKTLWCPMARVNDGTDTGFNRSHLGFTEDETGLVGGSLCVASRCMMWQWDRLVEPDEEKRGYCGLANTS